MKRLITSEQIEASKERRRAWYRARHARDKEKRNAARRAAHAANPERLREKDRENYRIDPNRHRRIDIKSKYGEAARDAYESINHCEACGDAIDGKRKHVDHDHSLPRKKGFRGILCNACNVALGYLKEDETRILALASYINRKRKGAYMKTFNNCAAQGDLLVRRIRDIPKNAKSIKPKHGKFILAHSETGHHHTVAERPGVEFFGTDDPLLSYLRVIEDVEVTLEHERSFDTHEPLLLKGGTYEIRRQREYVPNGWRRVAD